MFRSSMITHSHSLSLSPSGWFRSVGWGVSHTGSPSPLGSILHVHQVNPQVLHVVLHDVNPPFSLSSPTPLSTYVCLQESPDTILLFSALYMPKPSQPGLLYFVRDARYSEDATDIVIPFLVSLVWSHSRSVTCLLDDSSCMSSNNLSVMSPTGYQHTNKLNVNPKINKSEMRTNENLHQKVMALHVQ